MEAKPSTWAKIMVGQIDDLPRFVSTGGNVSTPIWRQLRGK
jgi:hypothetical protein